MDLMRYVVLSVDYEIFGNGSGDVLRHVVQPADSMARICREHGAPLTIFFEAEEYHSFVEFRQPLTQALGYDPAQKIADQVAALAAQGHDLQLHLHPEWVGARFQNGQWLLHRDKRTVDDLFDSQEETNRYIASRKKLLEDLLAPSAANRSVTAYRAGAFSAQPGAKLLAALAASGILIDSSVVKGLHGGPANLDYRQVPSAKGPWRIKDDVARQAVDGPLWEFPIYSVTGRRFQQATLGRLRAKFSRNVPKDRQMEMVSQLGLSRNPLRLLQFLWQPVPIKLDFHNVSPATLLRWIRSAPPPPPGAPDVVVLIGHTKEHIDDHAFENLLKGLGADTALKVVGFETLAKMATSLRGNAIGSLDNPSVLMA
ncbi:MAG: hypothetical protein ABSG59_06690 [Verrucomicrobiota bacterium]|jgi:hypothetical protein